MARLLLRREHAWTRCIFMERERGASTVPHNVVAIFKMTSESAHGRSLGEIKAHFAEPVNKAILSSSGAVEGVQVSQNGALCVFNVSTLSSDSRSFSLSYEGTDLGQNFRAVTNTGFLSYADRAALVIDAREMPDGSGAQQALLKALQLLAVHYNKEKLSVHVTMSQFERINPGWLFEFGMRLTHFDSNMGFMTLEKDLLHQPIPSGRSVQQVRLDAGLTPIAKYVVGGSTANEIAIAVGDPSETRTRIITATRAGYVGTGYFPAQAGISPALLYFQKAPTTSGISLPVSVNSEWQRLAEVIVGHTPEIVGPIYKNNKVAEAVGAEPDIIAYPAEHRAFIRALEEEGVRVTFSNAFDADDTGKGPIFARDPGFAIGTTFVVGKMVRENRAYEASGVETTVKGSVRITGENSFVEGGDVNVLDNSTVIVGLGDRTNRAGLKELAALFSGYNFIGVEIGELHLDVLFTVVGDRKVLADVTRLPAGFLDWIEGRGYEIIRADPQEPLGCNVLAIDDERVIAAAENRETNQRLRDAGVDVTEVSMPNLTKGGGGPRCMTCPTNRNEFEPRE